MVSMHEGVVEEVVLDVAVAEVVGECGEDHALVVGVVGEDGEVVLVVVGFEEAHVVVHAELEELLHILVDGLVVDADGHEGAVGGEDDAVGGGVLELEVGDAEGLVFVVLSVVELVVGCLGDAPGDGFFV